MVKLHATIALTNPKSPANVGAILRAAGCFDAQEILYTGNRFDKSRNFHTDTKDAHERIPLVRVEDFHDNKSENVKVICIDLVEGATPLSGFQHPDNAIYIFGPEDGTISQDEISKADEVVFIPTMGCLNLAQTVNIVLYDRATKLQLIPQNDELIRSSRDKNNSTRV